MYGVPWSTNVLLRIRDNDKWKYEQRKWLTDWLTDQPSSQDTCWRCLHSQKWDISFIIGIILTTSCGEIDYICSQKVVVIEFLPRLFLQIWTQQSSSSARPLSTLLYSAEIKSSVNLMLNLCWDKLKIYYVPPTYFGCQIATRIITDRQEATRFWKFLGVGRMRRSKTLCRARLKWLPGLKGPVNKYIGGRLILIWGQCRSWENFRFKFNALTNLYSSVLSQKLNAE